MDRSKRFLLLSVVTAFLLAAAGCQQPPAETEAPSAETAPAPAAEAEPAAQDAAPVAEEEEPAAVEETAAVEHWVVVIGADGHHRGEVTDVLGTVVEAERGSNFTKLDVGGKTTLSWLIGDRKIVVVDFTDLEATRAGLREHEWAGAVFVSDPAQSTGNRDEFLDAARAAGIDKLVLFQVVSDLLDDMEVYDLEAQVWPDELAAEGFSTADMPTLQAHVAKAAAGNQAERSAFVELLKAVEGL